MRDEEMLQKLLRLKRYETPGDDYFERFLDEFHARMARESRERHGLKDRLYTWLEELFPSPRLGWSAAAGGMMAVVAFAFVVSNNGPLGNAPSIITGTMDQRPFTQNLVQLPEIPPVPVPSAGAETAAKPSPIIFPDLIAPVSYTPVRSPEATGPDRVNLVVPGQFIRQSEWDDAMRLRDRAAVPDETILILEAEPAK
jgi:hypothetical protein